MPSSFSASAEVGSTGQMICIDGGLRTWTAR